MTSIFSRFFLEFISDYLGRFFLDFLGRIITDKKSRFGSVGVQIRIKEGFGKECQWS